MKGNYRTVFKEGMDEVIINKSRFIGYAKPIESEEDALEYIEKIKTKHRDATHNVSAYVFGENSNVQRFDDDGEPSGTAGIPALEVIKKEDLRNVVVVVTRYFGGIKLGSGGLIRAYTKGAKIGLEAAKIVEMRVHRKLLIKLDYHYYGKIENYLLVNEYLVDGTEFGAKILITICIDEEEVERFKEAIINFCNGDVEIEEVEILHLPVLDGKRLK